MVGRTISHYQITQRLGAGGMGEIFKAQDTRLNRTVAVKVLGAAHEGSDERRRRFLQEAQAASALNHPNIITIHDIVSEDETEFMVMEFVGGKTLGDLIPAGGLSLNLVLDYSIQIAAALEAAHAAGIVHRDLKPGNVMVTDAGLVKVLDFGLAKLTSPTGDAVSLGDETATISGVPLTVEGSILGTVAYMSPEQAEGKPVDARSDVFAFGAMLHEMVTGERAFAGDSAISTLSSILRDETRPLSQTAGIPVALESIAQRCLRKKREDRWQSMQAVRAALLVLKRDSDSGTLLQLPPVPPAERPRSKAMPLMTALAAVVVVAGVAGWWFIGGKKTPPAPAPVPVPVQSQPVETAPNPLPVPPAAPPPKVADNGVLNNDGVLEMVRAHVAPALIVEHIRSSKTQFDLSTSEVIRLTSANVPAEVISAMRNPKRPASVPTPGNNVPVPAVSAPPVPAAPTTPAPAVASSLKSVVVADAMPISITLAEDVPADAPAGQPLHFTVAREFRIGDALVLAAGSPVTGEIVDAARKKLIGGKNITYRLKEADTTGGGKLVLRAIPQRHGDDSRRPLEVTGGAKRPKDVAAVAGTPYVAYVDGDQTVTSRK